MKKFTGNLALVFSLLAFPLLAAGAEYKPYEEPNISPEQWDSYRATVVEKYGDSVQLFTEQHLAVYFNEQQATSYAFTTEGHAAHPAWITRQVVEDEGQVSIEQIGYFAGEEAPFSVLFRQYLELNEQIQNGH
ncbi:hypothetical protein [Aliidiomarina soli]|uniref:Uncharacterized protein n=1 Tax=Aliidiomarina soli TaxID=1928574 RepID=A0A432WM08_9GAMM|nr:hypothetical protein [Aliidiomarina soli]RUO34850.1 hypothetical protein CWE14_02305 [Aliidiomarina soli]